MKTLPLGTTGIDVSALCLGTMYFGSRTDEATSLQLLDTYYEAGGRFLDTANVYSAWVEGCSGGESETVIGKWLAERGCRDELVIATKNGYEQPGPPDNLTADSIQRECEGSLQRMGIETIDLYYSHVDSRNTPLEETLEAYDKLVQAGKVRFIGASNYRAWRLAEARAVSEANGWPAYCCVQERHTYLRPKAGAQFTPVNNIHTDEAFIDYCRTHDFPIVAYTPLLRGAYGRDDKDFPPQYDHDGAREQLKVLREVADEVQAGPNQVVLAWMIHSATPVIPLAGGSTVEQVSDNIAAVEIELTEDQARRLDEAGR